MDLSITLGFNMYVSDMYWHVGHVDFLFLYCEKIAGSIALHCQSQAAEKNVGSYFYYSMYDSYGC